MPVRGTKGIRHVQDQPQDLTSVLDPHWIANKDGLGLYRTSYSKKHVGALVSHLATLQNPAEHHVGDVLQVNPFGWFRLAFVMQDQLTQPRPNQDSLKPWHIVTHS